MDNVKIKRILASGAAAWAACTLAIDWTGSAGNFQLDDAANWASAPKSNDACYVRSRLVQPLKVGGDGDFFGGAMLRYTGSFTATNDFGAAGALTNIGLKAGSALHVEDGAKLVQVSGGLRCFKGTQYDGTYITANASLTLDGPDTWFEQKTGSVNLRANAESGNPLHPQLFVTNGASMTVGDLLVGCNAKTTSSYMGVGGRGTRVSAENIYVGAQRVDPGRAITNCLVVADYATVTGKTVIVGYNSADSGIDVVGGTMTVVASLSVGNRMAAASNCWLRVLAGGSLTNSGTTVIGRDESGNGVFVCVSGAGSSFTGLGAAALTGGVFRVEDGGKVRLQNAFSLCDSRVESRGEGASFAVTSGDTEARGASVVLSATDGATNRVQRLNVQNAVVEGGLDYEKIYMDKTGGELIFTNATVTGTRIEMTQSSTIRLVNTHLYVTNGIFMMGDLSGNNAANNAYKRDVYVGGTDTWVRVTQNNGFYVRGSNTTIHVEIPVEGFSTSHPVFDVPKIQFEGSRHLRIEVTADPQLARCGGTYTLFRTSADNSCHSGLIDWIYDPALIAIDKSVSREVHVRVKRLGGIIIVR